MQQASELVTAVTDFARQDEQIILADVTPGTTWTGERYGKVEADEAGWCQ